MSYAVWPRRLLVPNTVKLTLNSPSRGGGAAYDGSEQSVSSPASRWQITLSGIFVRSRDQVKVWRALEDQLDGRANPIFISAYDGLRAPSLPLLADFSDGSTFSDGSGFIQGSTQIVLSADAAANATQLQVSWNGPAPDAGQHFSIGCRMYRIGRLDPIGDASAMLTVRPWLRDPWPSGTLLDFSNPGCLMRLAKDDGMSMALEVNRYANADIDLVEYF